VRRICIIVACVGALVAGASPARAAQAAAGPGRVLVIGMPETEARRFLSEHRSAIGLGVFPDSRWSADFLAEVGHAAPQGLPGTPSPLAGAPGKLRAALDGGGKTVGVAVLSSAQGTPARALASAFGGEPVPVHEALSADVAVVVVQLADDAEALVRAPGPDRTVIVVGVGARTPLLIGMLDTSGLGTSGLLDHGVSERPGVVTPYDIAATIARAAAVTQVPGVRVLQVRPASDPFAALDSLRARFLRDHGFGPGLTGVTTGLAIFGSVIAVPFAALKRRRIAAAFARAVAMVPAGYVGALFVPSGRWYVRATVLVAAFVVGLVWPARSAKRFCGVVVLATALAIGVLTVVASRHPGGEPALSLWGDPLNSWRFFGIRNHLAAFVAGGFVLGTALLEAPLWLMVPGAVAAGIVVGAPTLGAQFIGVLTLSFGAAIELLGVIQRRVRAWHVPVAIVVASGAATAALLADAGRLYSHGGTAVESIRAGGWHTAWEYFHLRARLNYGEISSLGPKGFITFVLVALALSWLFVWGVRSSSLSPLLRAGVAGVAAAGMAALVVEDSGFLTAGIYLLYPALGFATGYADLALEGARRGGAPAAEEPPHDADDHDHADDDAGERE
jgi:hypothetical protein